MLFVVLFLYTGINEVNSATVYVYGKGGVIDLPNGTRCYCPEPAPILCAVIKEDASGVPEYPDILTHYDEKGMPIETVNVRRAGEMPNGQPTWWVQPPTRPRLNRNDKYENSNQEKDTN